MPASLSQMPLVSEELSLARGRDQSISITSTVLAERLPCQTVPRPLCSHSVTIPRTRA